MRPTPSNDGWNCLTAPRAKPSRRRGQAAAALTAGRLRAVAAGARRTFDVLDFRTETGSAGIGIDATEVETLHGALTRLADAHRRTLDQLSTGVAMFGADHRLSFYNAAYRALWDLDAAFLDQGPTDSAVIEVLRAARKLPEEQDFRQWKAQLHEAYRAVEAKEHTWHLPGGRTLRVVTTPNPDGGVTYLFHDVTERLDLERRFEELIRVQGETLDNLAEGVAVFGSDGRLRLHNAAFARMWRLSPRAARRAAAYRKDHGAYASRCTAMRRPGRHCATSSPRSTAAKQFPAGSNAATAAWSTAPPCRCPTAPRWSRSMTSPIPSTSSARCANATKRSKTPTRSRSISFITCPTSCARR